MRNKYNGIVIVPLRKRNVSSGYVKDLVGLSYIGNIFNYSKRKNFAVLYLSYSKGIVFYDTFLEREVITDVSDLWYKVVSEQIFRTCVLCSTSNVYLFIKHSRELENLPKYLVDRGIKVKTPIKGFMDNIIPKLLDSI